MARRKHPVKAGEWKIVRLPAPGLEPSPWVGEVRERPDVAGPVSLTKPVSGNGARSD